MDRDGNPAGHDHASHGGAVELACRLREFWIARCYNIGTTVESLQHNQHSVYAVRSDLKRGLPLEGSKVRDVAEAA